MNEFFDSIVNLFFKPTYIRQINNLNYNCDRLIEPIKNSSNSEKRFRIREMLKTKNEVIQVFRKDSERLIKQNIAKQIINLTTVYANLLENYYIRINDFDSIKSDETQNRIDENEAKLNTISDVLYKNKINDILEMDKQILIHYKEEQASLNEINDKLLYIESTAKLLKQQILSEIDAVDILEDIQSTLNESTALNNVLIKRKRQKI